MMLKPIIIIYALVLHVYGFILPDDPDVETLQTRIVGGSTAPVGRFPYQASLRTVDNFHFCGGSIVNAEWVLTAAHCTVGFSPNQIKVVVGAVNVYLGGDHHSVANIIVHENYDSVLIANDVSVVKVSKCFQFSNLVKPIRLPHKDTQPDADLVLSGWGRLSNPGISPIFLQFIYLKSISVEQCKEIYKDINPVYSSQICTLTKAGEGACYGDSGGPLVEGKSVVGIVSWGTPCARGYPDVYTRVYSFKDWILSKISIDNSIKNTES